MTYVPSFPDPRLMLPLTIVRRERVLPDDVEGVVEVRVNDRVTLRDVVARGALPAPYRLLDAARFFRLRTPEQLDGLMQIEIGDPVEQDQVIARRRRRRLYSPIDGRLTYVGGGRIIIQSIPKTIEVEAGVNGVVVEVKKGRGAVIETYGALLQGVWGNGKRGIGTMHTEPDEGLGGVTIDAIDIGLRGTIIVTRTSLTPGQLDSAIDQQLAGIIAPSMEPDLIETALRAPFAVLLTEGFGSSRMSGANFRFLDELDGKQATVDAVLPTPLEVRRPEVIVNVQLPGVGYRPPFPQVDRAVAVGMGVRLSRGEMAGFSGQVIDLPNTPFLLDNGLRVRCAQVQLNTGEKLTVPLENLEISG